MDAITADPHGKAMTPEEKRAKLNRLQQDMAILQSDRSRTEREVEGFRMELRLLEKRQKEILLEIQAKQKEVKKKENDLFVLEEEVRVAKKKINLVSG